MKINGLIIDSTVVGPVGVNCYIVRREGSKKCVVLDPGGSGERIATYINNNEMILEDILLTHGHYDHILGVRDLMNHAGGRLCVLDEEADLLSDSGSNLSAMAGCTESLQADVLLKDNQIYESADLSFRVIHTPGHTGGSCSYYLEKEKVLFCGDTLFFESIGRTDFPTGNSQALLDSVRSRLFVLPDDVKVLTGHGPATDIGYEKKNNPYF